MANLQNATPFGATLMPSCDQHGRDLLLLVVAAHFDIPGPGTFIPFPQVARVQTPPPLADTYVGKPGLSSLREEGQTAFVREATDIYLRGHAVAPQNEPVRCMTVSLQIGHCMFSLLVHGDRVWERTYGMGATPSPAIPFERMPLVWERAYGGSAVESNEHQPAFEPRNPVGCGFETNPSAAAGRPVPNLEDPADPIRKLSQRPRPTGLGPVARHWQPRVAHAGTYDKPWLRDRAPLWPSDFSVAFFNAAPPPLQVRPHLKGGELVTLKGFFADGPIQFHLPEVHLESCHQFAGLRDRRVTPVLDGIQLDTDAMSLTLYYRTALSAPMELTRHRGSLLRLRQPWERRT